jgi:hypothetical protein
MLTVSHPTVNGYVRALLQGLDESGQLQEFHTTIAVGRRAVKIAGSKVRQHPYREAVRLLGRRFRQEWLIRHESGWASVDAVAQAFDLQVAKRLIYRLRSVWVKRRAFIVTKIRRWPLCRRQRNGD